MQEHWLYLYCFTTQLYWMSKGTKCLNYGASYDPIAMHNYSWSSIINRYGISTIYVFCPQSALQTTRQNKKNKSLFRKTISKRLSFLAYILNLYLSFIRKGFIYLCHFSVYGSYTIQLHISLWPKHILVDNLWPNLLTPVIANGRGGLLLLPVYASSLGLSISQRHFLRISLRFMMVSSLGPFIHIIKLWSGHEWLITKHSILCDIITHPSPYFKGTLFCCDLEIVYLTHTPLELFH